MNELELNDKIIKASELTTFEFEKVNDDMMLDDVIYRVDADIPATEYGLKHLSSRLSDIDKLSIENDLTILRKAQQDGYKFVKLIKNNYVPLTNLELEIIDDYVFNYVSYH